jgi:hypothetical protein
MPRSEGVCARVLPSESRTKPFKVGLSFYQAFEKQVSGRQPPVKWPSDFTGQARRAVFWKAQHIRRYVSIYKSRATPDHGLSRCFSTAC